MNSFPDTPVYSFVVPIFNEEETLDELYQRLTGVMEQLDGATEVILIDDGSSDRSAEIMSRLHQQDPRFKVLTLSRNFGHQLAITAGLDYASGRAVIIMDGDLQDPPELATELAARWREGYDVVYAVRDERLEDALPEGSRMPRFLQRRFRTASASLFYRLLRKLTSEDIPADVGDFRLVDKRVLDAMTVMRERSRFLRGMFSWVGFKQTGVRYVRQGRYAGNPKYPIAKSAKLAADAIVSFSNIPLRLALTFGFVASAASFLAAFAVVVARLAGAIDNVPGWASIVVAVFFLGGVQLVMIGVMGEYVGRIYEEVKRRPLYLVSEEQGLARATPPQAEEIVASADPSALHR